MPDDSLSSLAGPAISLASSIFSRARRIHAERQAGQPFFGTGREDLLDEKLNETMARLLGETIDDVWWEELLARAAHPIITPVFLQAPALKEWLSIPEVQTNTKLLARARVMGADHDDETVRNELRQSYADSTGENIAFADEPIDVVVAILTAGFLASIDTRQTALAGIVQAQSRESRAGNQEIREDIRDLRQRIEEQGTDPFVVEAHTKAASKSLQGILKRRSLHPNRSREEIKSLAQRILEGDLRLAKSSERANVLYWAARLHSVRMEDLPMAKDYREQLRICNQSFDARIVEALILEAEGNVDGALQILRDINEPDGRATLFIILYRKRGKEQAIDWYENNSEEQDPNYLTGIGWTNLAIGLAEIERWEDAASILKFAQVHIEEWPHLVFIEGVINAAMLLPAELRQNALRMELFHPMIQTVRGPTSDELRAYANTCFDRASTLLEEIGEAEGARAAQIWRLWLRLTDPRPEISDVAQQEVRESMADGRRAVDLMQFTRSFSIDFDEGPLKLYLSQRAQLGGLKGQELIAEVLLAEKTKSPQDLADFLELEEDRLSTAVSKAMLVGLRIEALVAGGQSARARHLLNERQNDIMGHDINRLDIMVTSAEGADPRLKLEELYQQTGDLIDLQNLVRYLNQVADWTALHPLAIELFNRERTPANAALVINCLQKKPTKNYSSIISFFEDNPEVVGWGHDFSSTKAWAYFHIGDLKKAQRINDKLLQSRSNLVDLHLDINLAVQSGGWERFPAIVDREWNKRDDYDPDILLRLAMVAAESGTADRAIKLARLAASKAPQDAKVLMNAYVLTVQLGHERDADPSWIPQAAELSQEGGPVWRVDMRTVVEQMLPRHRERSREVERNLQRGNLPLHLASSFLNVPLSRLLIDIPHRNAQLQDGRHRVIVPIFSGARPTLEMRVDWAVGLDVTSIMVLHYLGLLEATLHNFQKVIIASETMEILLNERRRVRFHQPSLITDAEEIRELIENNRLNPALSLPEPPKWLIEEVGRDIAEMLEAARRNNGRVVRPRPIFKLSTFLEKKADLREYGDLILSTVAFAQLLHQKGYLEENMYRQAREYLLARDCIQKEEPVQEGDVEINEEGEDIEKVENNIEELDESLDLGLLDAPLYLDDLAVTYLQQAGLLQRIYHCNLKLWIHPSLKEEQVELIAANRHGEQLSEMLDHIRNMLHNAIESGRAILLPRHDLDIELRGTISGFLADTGNCDVICIDDRYLNRHGGLTDQKGRTVPIGCSLDLVDYLHNRGVLDTSGKWAVLHKLRAGGFALAPIKPEEVEHLLQTPRLEPGGHLIETAELRVLRQTLMRIRSLNMISQLEGPFLGGLRLACLSIIHRMWQNQDLPIDMTISLTEWIWKNILPSPIDWQGNASERPDKIAIRNEFVQHLALLLSPMLHVTPERYNAFLDWLERVVIEPLLASDADLMNELAIQLRAQMVRQIDRLTGNDQNASR